MGRWIVMTEVTKKHQDVYPLQRVSALGLHYSL